MGIKGIILDIDGVIVGEKIGFNSPSPHPKVISALKKIKSKGIFISLCTAKPHFAIRDMIKSAKLDNLHITDGGAVIIDSIDNIILKAHIINSAIAIKVLDAYLKNSIYTEFYTVESYFIQDNQASDITEKHTHVLQQKPYIVESLVEVAKRDEITKIIIIAKDEKDKMRLAKLFKPFENNLVLSWGVHPVALPLQFGIITAKGISKKNAAEEIVKSANISFDEILGVGDSTGDWQFIQLCKYAGALENASDELKELVMSKGNNYSFIGPTVDKNGVIDIFEKFKLI